MHGIGHFLVQNPVFTIALVAALLTACIVPPDGEYLSYFDFKTLSCLFSVLAVVCALKTVNFFTIIARSIVKRFTTTRTCFLALLYITFIGSMFIANDMALITFLPLGWMILDLTGQEKYTAFLFILQNISANLGGMLTPFGNPQNLYLYTYFNIPTGEFMSIMLIPFAVSVLLLTVCCFFVRSEKLTLERMEMPATDPKKRNIYLILFVLSVVIVFRIIPYWLGLAVIVLVLLYLCPEALKKVDFPLLFTFAAFFVFSGNMSRIPAVRALFSMLLEKNTLLFSILSCQVISNVPSAILLSQFTSDYASLLHGVNIGGTGTLIASLASLITFREFRKHRPGQTKRYLLLFTAFNLLFLGVLTAVSLLTN
ncbi:MAG: citrate transporter [Ruminococcaceae bacterium]|nr:citrate transporter [Oscillospiraceae bacterium]